MILVIHTFNDLELCIVYGIYTWYFDYNGNQCDALIWFSILLMIECNSTKANVLKDYNRD